MMEAGIFGRPAPRGKGCPTRFASGAKIAYSFAPPWLPLRSMPSLKALAAVLLIPLACACTGPAGVAPVEDRAPLPPASQPAAEPAPPAPPPAAAEPEGAVVQPIAPREELQVVPLPPAPAAPPPPTEPEPPAKPRDTRPPLSSLIPPGATDREGWANDIHAAFTALRIPPTTDNACAAIAVIHHLSDFHAEPVVPNLSGIVWKEIETRRRKYGIPRLVLIAALATDSPDGRSYKTRIDALRTERQMNDLFEDMVDELPQGKRLLGGYNPVRTGGPMQVSITFAEEHARQARYPYAPRRKSLRDEVFTRRGGVYFGVANLLDYPAPYSRMLYRFADFNAGRYSSRNAAFQGAVARLSRKPLTPDGDLLRYDGNGAASRGATWNALVPLAKRLGMSTGQIRRDLEMEKSAAFGGSELYRRVFALADKAAGRPLPREAMPRIRLSSPKIRSKLTTEWFAHKVDGRYRECMQRAEPWTARAPAPRMTHNGAQPSFISHPQRRTTPYEESPPRPRRPAAPRRLHPPHGGKLRQARRRHDLHGSEADPGGPGPLRHGGGREELHLGRREAPHRREFRRRQGDPVLVPQHPLRRVGAAGFSDAD